MVTKWIIMLVTLTVGTVTTVNASASPVSEAALTVGSPPATSGPPTLVIGRLFDDHGAAVSGRVSVYVAPELQVGDPAQPEEQIATTVSDENGQFQLSADPAAGPVQGALVRAARQNGGWVNFDLIAATGGQIVYRAVARHLVNGQWVETEDGKPPTAPASVDLKVSKGAPGVAPASAKRSLAGKANPNWVCFVSTDVVAEGDAYTTYGELHTGTDHTAYFRYGESADSNIGVGFSYGDGNWSISGTAHVGNNRGASEQWNVGEEFGYKLRSEFHYKKYRTEDGCDGITYYEVKATSWNAGQEYGSGIHYYDHHCLDDYYEYRARFYPGNTFTREDSESVTFGGAASAFGASLTAQSGFSSNVISHWHFGYDYSAYWLCGNDNYIPYSHRIFAGG
jgi:hypothetical protein